MKDQNSDASVSVQGYFSSDCEMLIAPFIIEFTNTTKQKAEELAEAKLPRTDDDLNSYTSWITSKFNTLQTKVLSKLNIDGLKSKGFSILTRFKKREDELSDKSIELISQIREKKKEVDKSNAQDILAEIKQWRFVHLVIVLLVCSEIFALEQAMGALSSSGIIGRSIIASAVCICTYFIAKKHVTLSREAETKIKRVAVNIGMFTLAGTIFYLFGTLRMHYLGTMDEDFANRSNAWLFAGVSSVYYLGCVLAKSIYMPTALDRKRAIYYTQKKNELDEMNLEQKEIEKELKELPQQREDALYEIYSLIKMAEHYQAEVNHGYQTVIGEFILHNNIKRHDGKTISISQYKGGIIPPLEQYEFKTEEL